MSLRRILALCPIMLTENDSETVRLGTAIGHDRGRYSVRGPSADGTLISRILVLDSRFET
jgi:hypothetical protein